jgi:integrase/recombinase XerC
MVQSFLKYLEFEKRYSRHTVISYQTDLDQLSGYLDLNYTGTAIETADFRILRSWLISLIESGIQPRSVNRKIATLRSYFKFLRKHGHITADPMLKVKVLKTKKSLPYFVNEPEIIKMLDGHNFGDDFPGLRDKLILELLYGTGIRLSELIGLETSDVNLNDGTIKVLGKRNKERIIPLNQELIKLIKSYRDLKKSEVTENEITCLIVNNDGGKCYPMMIYRTVKKYLDIFSVVEKKSPHVLRHTFATHLLDKGADLNAVKDLLGHSSLAATQVYTHNSLEKLKKVFDQAHPKA